MKRKRGHKKGKPKESPAVGANEAYLNVSGLNTEVSSGLVDFDSAEYGHGVEVDTPSSTGTDQPDKLANINPDGSVDKTLGQSAYARVKVKLRAQKMLESQPTSSDPPTQSDTDKSSQQMGLEKQGVVTEKMEDSANSLAEMKIAVSGTPLKKSGSITFKSSRGFGSLSINQTSNAVQEQGKRPYQEVSKTTHRYPRCNNEELSAALAVIKKVMRMDAAEPFNTPVNPIALGIPDYFDVIDTPMDFGTICSNLENGVKYMNSEDVYKDVQYIWENCFKYNNKGDYIIDLVKRVKKNFTKYWTAAGLYSEQQRINGLDSIQAEEVTVSSQEKIHVKGGCVKHKNRKRHGVKRHRDGCLCAICVLKRRRKEREENSRIVEDQLGISSGDLAVDATHEETSPVESPGGGNTSSDMENSLDPDSDADLEEREEVKSDTSEQQYYSPPQQEVEKQEEENEHGMEMEKKGEGESGEQTKIFEGFGEDPSKGSETQRRDESGAGVKNDIEKVEVLNKESAASQQQNLRELQVKHKKCRMYGNFENPMVLKLCGTLFPDDPESIWSGPHSLVLQQSSARTTSIHAAIATFIK